jgi:chromosome segregation ATPase
VGFHQERVAELEAQLEALRNERLKAEAGAAAIRDALSSSEIATEIELAAVRRGLQGELELATAEIEDLRAEVKTLRSHAMDRLQREARDLAARINELQQALQDIRETIAKDKAHKNELLSLATRFRRSQSAREVLSGVEFTDCPRCGQPLPQRSIEVCRLCGQVPSHEPISVMDNETAERDLKARVDELSEITAQHEAAVGRTERQLRELSEEKRIADSELTRISTTYDSAYLSSALQAEKRRSSIQQQLIDLEKLEVLVRKIQELLERVHILSGEEQKVRSELREAREKAEKDTITLPD